MGICVMVSEPNMRPITIVPARLRAVFFCPNVHKQFFILGVTKNPEDCRIDLYEQWCWIQRWGCKNLDVDVSQEWNISMNAQKGFMRIHFGNNNLNLLSPFVLMLK